MRIMPLKSLKPAGAQIYAMEFKETELRDSLLPQAVLETSTRYKYASTSHAFSKKTCLR